MMRVYLASAFNLADRVEELAEALESEGHRVAVKWWSRDGFDLRDKGIEAGSLLHQVVPVHLQAG